MSLTRGRNAICGDTKMFEIMEVASVLYLLLIVSKELMNFLKI